jgi:hypothetical protein
LSTILQELESFIPENDVAKEEGRSTLAAAKLKLFVVPSGTRIDPNMPPVGIIPVGPSIPAGAEP